MRNCAWHESRVKLECTYRAHRRGPLFSVERVESNDEAGRRRDTEITAGCKICAGSRGELEVSLPRDRCSGFALALLMRCGWSEMVNAKGVASLITTFSPEDGRIDDFCIAKPRILA